MKSFSKKNINIIPLIIAVFIVAGLILPSFIETFAVATDDAVPTFTISGAQSFSVDSGSSNNINVSMQNDSYIPSVFTTVTVSDDKGELGIVSGTSRHNYTQPGGYIDVEFTVNVPSLTPTGKYPVTIKLKNTKEKWNYTTDGPIPERTTSEQTMTVYIDVQNNLKPTSLNLINFTIDKPTVQTGEVFNLTVSLANDCGVDLFGVKVTLDGLDGTKFGMNSGVNSQVVDITEGNVSKLTYQLVACEGIASIREVLPLKVNYQTNPNDKATAQELLFNVTVPCKVIEKTTTVTTTVTTVTTTEPQVFAPKIIIENYSFGNEYVTGGKVFPLSMTIRNTSPIATIYNLKVTVQGGAGTGDKGVAFSPANSSNSFFFKSLGINETTDIAIDLLSKVDAKPDSYPVEVVFEFEYMAYGKRSEAKDIIEKISIPLQQEDRFEANQPEVSPQCQTGQECQVALSFVNKGKSAVYNVSVDVEGEGFEKTSTAYYIGNIESGKEESYDTRIIPLAAGDIKGNIVVTYEDSNGTAKELSIPFMTQASEPMIFPDEGINMDGNMGILPMEPEKKGLSKSMMAIIIGGGGAVIVVVVLIIVLKLRKKKKNKALELGDDSDDDDEKTVVEVMRIEETTTDKTNNE